MDFQRHFYCVFFYTNISFCKSSHQNLAGNPVKLFHKMARETVKRDAESVWKERERERISLCCLILLENLQILTPLEKVP